MSKPHKYRINPEFENLEKFVWEGLNNIGRTISQISDERRAGYVIAGDPKQIELRGKPIWHSKTELDEFVARSLGIDQNDYSKDKGKNPFYKAVANELGRLRRSKVLMDWKHQDKRNTGMGVWRLDKQKLESYAAEQTTLEIKEKNYHSDGSEMMVYVRAKQGAFREALFREYCKCALCGFKIPDFMIGAHIVPYSVMRKEESENAMNPANGLLLCRFCDVAFEKGTIMIEGDLGIIISDQLQDRREEIVKAWLAPIPPELYIKKDARYPPAPKYLKWKKELILNK